LHELKIFVERSSLHRTFATTSVKHTGLKKESAPFATGSTTSFSLFWKFVGCLDPKILLFCVLRPNFFTHGNAGQEIVIKGPLKLASGASVP
jgi:hypothetical protein